MRLLAYFIIKKKLIVKLFFLFFIRKKIKEGKKGYIDFLFFN